MKQARFRPCANSYTRVARGDAATMVRPRRGTGLATIEPSPTKR